MILEIFAGFLVSTIVIIFFLLLRLVDSVNNWIIANSKFMYYSGHPLLDENEIHKQIKKRFNSVFISLIIVVLKILIFFIFIFIAIGLSSFLVSLIRSKEILNFDSSEFLVFYFPEYLLKWPFIIGSFLPVFILALMRKKEKEKVPYSTIEKFLHYVLIGNSYIARFLFKIELWFRRKQLKATSSNNSVYISGMARAGTTVLMQYLGQLNEFKSLSYRNLPFLFLPITGQSIFSNKKNKEKERFHQDGMLHSLDSYEALEEPFFRNFIGKEYILDKTLINHVLNQKSFNNYNSFRKLVAGNKIYLSKNNNHLLRADSIHELDKSNGKRTKTIIPFRDPYEQSKSLLRQHLLLSDLQREDEFTLDYMDFLVHHEFGLNHRISVIDSKIELPISNLNMNSLDSWLEIWYLFYDQVYQKFSIKENFHFFCYENFTNQPKKSLEDLLIKLELSESLIDLISLEDFNSGKNEKPDNELSNKYVNLYKKLKLIALNNYG